MMDTDDEVRDRATFYYHVLRKEDKQLASSYILNSKLSFRFSLTIIGFFFPIIQTAKVTLFLALIIHVNVL